VLFLCLKFTVEQKITSCDAVTTEFLGVLV